MRLLNTVVASVVILLCAATHAQGELRGEVVDIMGAKIANATIRVLDEKSRKTVETARSDQDGGFHVQDLAGGRYLIVASAPGFSEKLIDIGIVHPDVDVFRKIRLTMLDCDAPHMNCDTFSTGPIEDPHPIVSRGRLTVGSLDAVDLEKVRAVPPEAGTSDLCLSKKEGGLYLTPLHKAENSKVCGKDFGQGGVQDKKSSLRIDGLGSGSAICIRTNHGRISKIFLTREVQLGDKDIDIYIVTRAR
jgi:hypothetical protein